MQKLLTKALDFGTAVYSHFEKNPYPTGLDMMFHGVIDDTSLWEPVFKTKQSDELLKQAERDSSLERDSIIALMYEYAYDIGVALHRWRGIDLDKELQSRANLLFHDLTDELPKYVALSPVFKLDSNVPIIDFGSCILRFAGYLERNGYRPTYPPLAYPYGPAQFTHVIDLESRYELKEIEEGLGNYYMKLCSNVVSSLRLVCGGDAGLQFLSARNHFERLDLGKQRKPGSVYPLHRISHYVARVWRSGTRDTFLDDNDVSRVLYIFNCLSEFDSERHGFILRAIRRFCGAREQGSGLDDSILDIAIAFESLFGDNKYKASKRCAASLSSYEGYDQETADRLRKLWDARNAFAHGDSIVAAEKRVKEDLSILASYAFRCLRASLLLAVSMKPANYKEFRKQLDSLSKRTTPRETLLSVVPTDIRKLVSGLYTEAVDKLKPKKID